MAALGRLRTLARRLPSACLAALEIRLASGPAPVDLSVRLATPEQARHVAGWVSPPHLRRFLIRWADCDELLAPLSSLWLELDLDAPSDAARLTPSICARFEQGCDPVWLIDHLLPELCGEPLGAARQRQLRRALEALPPSANLLYAFAMLSRPGRPVRLETFGPRTEEMAPYLRRLVPSATPAAEAVKTLARVAPLIADLDRVHLAFDIASGGEILPRIGIDGSYARLPQREPRWAAFFDRLEGRGLCCAEKRRGVFAWPGYDTPRTAAQDWPRVDGRPIPGFCVRALSHVKILCRPEGQAEAKVYLFVQHLERAGEATASRRLP